MKTLFRVTMLIILSLTLANTNCVGVPNAVGDATATKGINAERNITVPAGVTQTVNGAVGGKYYEWHKNQSNLHPHAVYVLH